MENGAAAHREGAQQHQQHDNQPIRAELIEEDACGRAEERSGQQHESSVVGNHRPVGHVRMAEPDKVAESREERRAEDGGDGERDGLVLGELAEERKERDEHRAATNPRSRREHRRQEDRDGTERIGARRRKCQVCVLGGFATRRVEALVARGEALVVILALAVALLARRRALRVRLAPSAVRAPAASIELRAGTHARSEGARVDARAAAGGAAGLVRVWALAARRRALVRRRARPGRGAPAAAGSERRAGADVLSL